MKELTSGKTVQVAQRMIKQPNEFEAALGAALLHGKYRDRRKIISTWPELIDKHKG